MATRIISAGILAACASTFPAAATVTFDRTQNPGGISTPNGGSLVSEGYRFTLSDATNGFVQIVDTTSIVNNGTPDLLLANNGALTMTQAGPATGFTLTSFQLGGSFTYDTSRWATGVLLTGTLLDGSTVLATFLLPTSPTMETRMLPAGFTRLSSVRFTPIVNKVALPNNYEFTLDNLEATATAAVPEPATWAAMVLGMGVIGAATRRARRSTGRPAVAC